MLTHNTRHQISATLLYDDDPVVIYVDAIDSYYPHPTYPDCTTLNLRSGVSHEVRCAFAVVRKYLTRDMLHNHKDLSLNETDGQ